jgi:hypothetical protein
MKKAAKVFIIIGMVLGFYAIVPIIVGILALKKLNEASRAQELETLGILTIIFCSVLGGILMLCVKDDDLSASAPDYIQNIKDLNELYKGGSLTKEEYETLKAEQLK